MAEPNPHPFAAIFGSARSANGQAAPLFQRGRTLRGDHADGASARALKRRARHPIRAEVLGFLNGEKLG